MSTSQTTNHQIDWHPTSIELNSLWSHSIIWPTQLWDRVSYFLNLDEIHSKIDESHNNNTKSFVISIKLILVKTLPLIHSHSHITLMNLIRFSCNLMECCHQILSVKHNEDLMIDFFGTPIISYLWLWMCDLLKRLQHSISIIPDWVA